MSLKNIFVDDIAVVVAFKNESRYLDPCVTSLLQAAAQTQADLVFVDDASTDDSVLKLKPYQGRIKLISSNGTGPGRARNLAWKSTAKNHIIFLDADTRVPETWLRDFVREAKSIQDESAVSVGGRQVLYSGAKSAEVFYTNLLSSLGFVSDYIHVDNSVRRVGHNPTCNVLYLKRALEFAQGFDEGFWPCEDLDLDLRLNRQKLNVYYSPNVFVEHKRPETLRQLSKMMQRYGFGHSKLMKKHGPCQPLHALPFLAFIVFGVSFFYPVALVLAPVGLFFLLCFKLKSLYKAGVYFPFTAIMIASWLYGFFKGYLSSQKIAEPRHV